MKKQGFFLILIIIMGILPIQAQTDLSIELTEPYTANLITYYPESQGYDVVKKPDDTTWIYSQRYHVEALDGPKWKQVGIPYKLTLENQIVTRHYTDYLGTEIQVSTNTETRKTNITVNSGASREYRIVWTLDGVTNTDYTVSGTKVNFTSNTDWIAADWSDAQVQGTPLVSDSANGKKLEVTFNIGTIEAGQTYTLDPVLQDSYGTGNQNSDFDLQGFPGAAVSYTSIGCTFTTGKYPIWIYSVKLHLQKTANPTADIQVQIYRLNTSLTVGVNATPATPIFDSIANSTIVDSSTLPAGPAAYTLVSFNFTGAQRILLNASTSYGLVLLGISGTGNLDLVNQVNAGADSTPAGDDNTFFTNDAGLTWKLNNWDLIYYVYGLMAPVNINVESDGSIARNAWDWVNATIYDDPLDLDNVTLFFFHHNDHSYNYTLRWVEATNTFSEAADPRGLVTLNAGASANLNATTIQLSYNITQTAGLAGNYDCNLTTYDIYGNNDTDTYLTVYNFVYFNWNNLVYDLINSAFKFWDPTGGLADAMADLQTLITGVVAYWGTSISNVVLFIVQQFRIITNVVNWYIRWVTRFVDFFLTMGEIIVGLWNGTGTITTGLGNFWTYISFDTWYEVVPVFLFIYWITTVENRGKTQGEITVMMGDLNNVLNIMSYFTSMFMMVINIIVDYTFRLFDAIT